MMPDTDFGIEYYNLLEFLLKTNEQRQLMNLSFCAPNENLKADPTLGAWVTQITKNYFVLTIPLLLKTLPSNDSKSVSKNLIHQIKYK